MTSRVPQGSNLRHFFLSFINDITSVLTCYVQMFADDVKIVLPGRIQGFLGRKDHLVLCTYEATDWDYVPRNHKKTTATYTRKTIPSHSAYMIDGVRKDSVSVSDLMVLIDLKLLYHHHIDIIVSNGRRNLGLIKRIGRRFKRMLTSVTLYSRW